MFHIAWLCFIMQHILFHMQHPGIDTKIVVGCRRYQGFIYYFYCYYCQNERKILSRGGLSSIFRASLLNIVFF